MKAYDISKLSFLIVEPNKHMVELVRMVLHEFKVDISNVMVATNCHTAYEVFRSVVPDLVITEWSLPDKTGLEFIQMIRTDKESPNPYVPIIMLTSHAEKKNVVMARDHGVTEFLSKPLTISGLYSRIVAVIERPRSFVKSEAYSGPDRRRHKDPYFTGPWRRCQDFIDFVQRLAEDVENAAREAMEQAADTGSPEIDSKAVKVRDAADKAKKAAQDVEQCHIAADAEAIYKDAQQHADLAINEVAEIRHLALGISQTLAMKASADAVDAEAATDEPALDPSAMTQEELAATLDKKEN